MSSSMRQRGQAPNSIGSPPPHQKARRRQASATTARSSWEISAAESPEHQSFVRHASSHDSDYSDSQHSRSASAAPVSGGGLFQETNPSTFPQPWERTASASSSNLNPQAPQPVDAPPSLHNFHTLYRTAHHVPDSRYAQYLLGQTSRRKDDGYFSRDCCTSTCAGFSIIGFLFFLWIGLLIDTQPILMKGALLSGAVNNSTSSSAAASSHSRTRVIPGPDSDRLPMASVAYQAAFFYLVIMFIAYGIKHLEWTLSQWYMWKLLFVEPSQFRAEWNNNNSKWRKQHYEDIPDHHMDASLPRHHAGVSGSSTAAPSGVYRPPCWNRCTIAFTNWLYARGWYTPARRRRPQDDRQARTV